MSAATHRLGCWCEHADHFDDEPRDAPTPRADHPYGALVEAPLHEARWIGQACAVCLDGHLAGVLAKGARIA